MLFCLILAFIGAMPGQAEFKTDQVNIRVNIQSSVYTYEVTNISSSDIVSFELDQYACYNFTAPDGWEIDLVSGVFKAWAGNAQTAIGPKKTGKFSLRVSSSGAVLGRGLVKLKLQSGETVTVAGVWAPVREPRSYMVLVASMVLLVLIGHTCILSRRDRRKKNACVNDA